MKNATSKTATTTPTTTPATTAAPEMPLKTKHLAAKFGMKATQLRRVLRSMPAYADGVHTNYRWTENDARIADIEAAIKRLADEKASRATAAKAALAARVAKAAAEAKADAAAKA